MKQLKVIVPSYSTTDGIFRASFKDTVTIDPNSKVVFDKIAFILFNNDILPTLIRLFNMDNLILYSDNKYV